MRQRHIPACWERFNCKNRLPSRQTKSSLWVRQQFRLTITTGIAGRRLLQIDRREHRVQTLYEMKGLPVESYLSRLEQNNNYTQETEKAASSSTARGEKRWAKGAWLGIYMFVYFCFVCLFLPCLFPELEKQLRNNAPHRGQYRGYIPL